MAHAVAPFAIAVMAAVVTAAVATTTPTVAITITEAIAAALRHGTHGRKAYRGNRDAADNPNRFAHGYYAFLSC
jgi:hypothetical protein